jgi:2,4-dienoyl-CoA reductase-like NADH-dependent reductase (Old Yellow Enzyme family)
MAGLLDPIRLGEIECRNRIAMAPCTRCMSPGFVPTDAVAAYYERRAADGVGLLITEGTVICERGNGYPDVPGIFAPEQITAWRKVTDGVHAAGGKIICQIWHVGAVAHPFTTGGVLPESPSGRSPAGDIKRLRRPDGSYEQYGESETISEDRIHELIDLYRQAAANSIEAGFDGVEIHGAHGYLIDAFINLHWNRREDDWGGENRTRFAREVARAVVDEIGAGRTQMRISPVMSVSGEAWQKPEETFPRLLTDLHEAGLRTLHISNLDYDEAILPASLCGGDSSARISLHEAARALWSGQIIGVGSLTVDRADRAISDGEIDMAAFGRSLIANPDFVSRVRAETGLENYRPEMLETLV